MLATTRLAAKLRKEKEAGRGYYRKHIEAMLSYMGWYSYSDTYNCYLKYIKPCVDIGRLKDIISKLDRRKDHEGMETGDLRNAA